MGVWAAGGAWFRFTFSGARPLCVRSQVAQSLVTENRKSPHRHPGGFCVGPREFSGLRPEGP